MTTGECIKAARKRAGLTQEELGQKLNVSASMISQYENSAKTPKHGTILRFAKALGVLPDELYGIDDWLDSNNTLIEYIGNSFGILKCILDRPDITYDEIKLLIINSFPNFDELYDELGGLSANIISASIYKPVKLLDNELASKLLKLNDAGVKIALERIDELAEIPRYQYQHTCICGNEMPPKESKAETQPEEEQ